ncbi:unnamed protein product [Miscanthus lutarioriparius]|uniref:Uncharacterized protein n=1 Tax=Miscanthus lutarioriparius TaxID=422564 RepID=A0A811NCK7_9POAL|nr:unnamed protein product [Miscanthus lutarioriparius]
MSRRGCTKEHFFSEADMETINMDNRLKDLVKIDSKMVKKILHNREYASTKMRGAKKQTTSKIFSAGLMH